MNTQPDFHFYASSVAMWATTTPTRDLRELLKRMDSDGYRYHLFLVPVAHNAPYEIKFYEPQVQGAQYLGSFEPPERKPTRIRKTSKGETV